MQSKIYVVLDEARQQLLQLSDPFYIIGSAALVLSGIEGIKISDIDILTSDRDANYLKEAWSSRRIGNHITKENELFKSNFSRYRFSNLDIEVMGELKVNVENVWLPLIIHEFEVIQISGHNKSLHEPFAVKIPTLQEQLRIFDWFGRGKDLVKVSILNKHLKKF